MRHIQRKRGYRPDATYSAHRGVTQSGTPKQWQANTISLYTQFCNSFVFYSSLNGHIMSSDVNIAYHTTKNVQASNLQTGLSFVTAALRTPMAPMPINAESLVLYVNVKKYLFTRQDPSNKDGRQRKIEKEKGQRRRNEKEWKRCLCGLGSV